MASWWLDEGVFIDGFKATVVGFGVELVFVELVGRAREEDVVVECDVLGAECDVPGAGCNDCWVRVELACYGVDKATL